MTLLEGLRWDRRDASNTSNSWTLVYTADVTITDFTVINGAGYICVPSRLDATSPGNTDFYYQSDPTAAATWTPTARAHAAFSDALGKPKYFRQVRTSTFAVVDNRKVFYSVDPDHQLVGWPHRHEPRRQHLWRARRHDLPVRERSRRERLLLRLQARRGLQHRQPARGHGERLAVETAPPPTGTSSSWPLAARTWYYSTGNEVLGLRPEHWPHQSRLA